MKQYDNQPVNIEHDLTDRSADGGLHIDPLQCLNLRGRHISCTQCADTCATNALRLSADEVTLDSDRCTACGACLPVCPSGALLLGGFDPRQFLHSVAGTPELHIHCSRSDHPNTESRVPCLQLLDARLLAAATAAGTQTVVLHGSQQCSNCKRGDAHAAIEHMHTDLKKWFSDVPVLIVQTESAQAEKEQVQIQMDRRNFLRTVLTHAAHSTSAGYVDTTSEPQEATPRWPLISNNGNSHRPSTYQQLLAERVESLPWRDGQLPWRTRLFNERCNACLSCTQLCPTGALTAQQTKTTISIWIQLHLCTDCDLCVRLCPENAISCVAIEHVSELHSPARRVLLRSLRICTSCGHDFVPGPNCAERCTTCQNEYAIADDWKTMLTE